MSPTLSGSNEIQQASKSEELLEQRIIIGQNVQRLRMSAQLSLRDLEKKIKSHAKVHNLSYSISHTKLGNIEKGLVTTSRRDLKLLSAVLKLPMHLIVDATDVDEQNMLIEAEKILKNGGDYSTVIELSNTIFQNAVAPRMKAVALNTKGRALIKMGQFREASQVFDRLLTEHTWNDPEYKYKVLINLAICSYRMENYYKGIQFLRLAKEYENYDLDDEDAMKIAKLEPLLYMNVGDLDQALLIYTRLRNEFQSNRPIEAIEVSENIAEIYKLQGQLEKCFSLLKGLYDWATTVAPPKYHLRIAISLSDLYIQQENLQNAKEILNEAYNAQLVRPEPYLYAHLLYRYSLLTDSPQKKEEYLREAYNILKDTDLPALEGLVCDDLSNLYTGKNIELELFYMRCARDAYRKLSQNRG